MQSINIFIASSYEMAEWRLAIGNAIREWSDRNEPQGFRIRLHCWEDYHPEYTGTRKQDEYNEDLVKTSQLFFALFREKCGIYTQEEIRIGRSHLPGHVHILRDAGANNPSAVDEFLSRENLTAVSCEDVDTAIAFIHDKVKNFMATLPPLRPMQESRPEKYVYATLPNDREQERIPLGNLIRSMDHLTESKLGIRCRLFQQDIKQLPRCDYFIGILKNQLSHADETEITQAIINTRPSSHPEASVLYYNYEDKAIENHHALKALMQKQGVFKEDFDGYHRIRYNLLTWLLSKLLLQIDERSGLSVQGDWGLFMEDRIIREKDLKLSGSTDQEKTVNLLLSISRKLLGLSETLSQTPDQPIDITLLDQDIRRTNAASVLARQIHDDAIEAKKAILDNINGRLAHMKRSATLAKEMFDLALRKQELEKELLELNLLTPREVLRTQMFIIRIHDTYPHIIQPLGFDCDRQFLAITELADRHDIADPDVEIMRMNWGNALSRSNRNREALAVYHLSLENLKRLDDGSALMIRYLPSLYLNYTHSLIELGEYETALRFVRELETALKQWSADRLLPHPEIVYRALLNSMKLRLFDRIDENIETILAESIGIWTTISRSKEPLPVPEDKWDDIYCYFPTIVAATLLDTRSQAPKDRWKAPKAIEILLQAEAFVAGNNDLNPHLKRFHLAQIYHNLAYGTTDNLQARAFAQKALEYRRELYDMDRQDATRGEIAEALLMIGATYINGVYRTLSPQESAEALAYAEECLTLYTELNTEGFLKPTTKVYEAKLLKGTVLRFTPGRSEQGISLIKKCLEWSRKHPDNSYRDTFESEGRRLLP